MHYGVLAFTMVGVPVPALRGSRTRKIIKKPSVFKHFQKKWCWRSSFEVPRGSFRRMLQLICLFCFQNPLWPGWPPRGPQGGLPGSLVVCLWPPSAFPGRPFGPCWLLFGLQWCHRWVPRAPMVPQGGPKASQGIPKGFQNATKGVRAFCC